MDNLMEKIVSLCKRRGFVFPGSEIYGGLSNSWDFGPAGTELKKNIKDLLAKIKVVEESISKQAKTTEYKDKPARRRRERRHKL